MANVALYRGYPPLSQGIEAGKEVITLITTGAFRSDLKHSLAVCDTIEGAILGVYPGAPAMSTTQAVSAEVKAQANQTFSELKTKLNELVNEGSSPTAKATEEGSKDLGALSFADWLPYIKILLDLIEKWFARPTV